MSMRDRLELPARGAPVEPVAFAGPGGNEETAFPGAEMPEPVEIRDPAWSLVTGKGSEAEDPLGDLRHLQHLLDAYPQGEGAMVLQAMGEIRSALNRVGLDDDAHTPIAVPAWVLVMAARKLTRALR